MSVNHPGLLITISGSSIPEFQEIWENAMKSSDELILKWCTREVVLTLLRLTDDTKHPFCSKLSDMFRNLTIFSMQLYSTNDTVALIRILTDLSQLSNMKKGGPNVFAKHLHSLVVHMCTCKKSRVFSQLMAFYEKIEKRFFSDKKQFGHILDTSDEDEDDFVICGSCKQKVPQRNVYEEYTTYFAQAIRYLNICLRSILERDTPSINISLNNAVVNAIKGYVQLTKISNITPKNQAFILNIFINEWILLTNNYHTIIPVDTDGNECCPGSDLLDLTYDIISCLRDPISLRTSYLFILTITINQLSKYPASCNISNMEVSVTNSPSCDVSLTSESEIKQYFLSVPLMSNIILTRARKRQAQNNWCNDEFVLCHHQIPIPSYTSFLFNKRKRHVYSVKTNRYQVYSVKRN